MVERHLAKVEVAGSSPVIRSIKKQVERLAFFVLFGLLRKTAKAEAGKPMRPFPAEYGYR